MKTSGLLFVCSALASVATLGGCGGAGPFSGAYSGNFQSTITQTAPVAQTIPATGMTTLSIADGATSDMVFDLSKDLGTGCLLNASRNGSSATIAAGQACTSPIQNGSLTLTVTNGVATVNGAALMITIGGNMTGSAGGQAVTGTFSYSFAGSKK